jgi:hypothetical protein
MKFLIGPDQVYFNFKKAFTFKFLKSWYCPYIGFESADPGIVTIRRIFNEFGSYQPESE